MNKKEKEIILNQYRQILFTDRIVGIDKDDARHEMWALLNALGLENERIEIENNIYFEQHNLSYMQVQGYKTLVEIISKYVGRNVNIDKIEVMLDAIEFELTEEHKKNIKACYELINN